MGLLDFLFGKPKTAAATDRLLPATVEPARALTSAATVLDVRVGDAISYDSLDYVVRNRHHYQASGWESFSYQLVDSVSGSRVWIDAEDDDELEITVSQEIDFELLTGSDGSQLDTTVPLPERIVYEGTTYHRDEAGRVRVTVESEDSAPRTVDVQYWDYLAGDDFLGIERWGDEFEASIGHAIEPYELNIFQAGGNA